MDPFASARFAMTVLADEMAAQSDKLNEATTRLRWIDKLLADCLGWGTGETEAEGYSEGDYVDYALGAAATEAILEAKREGVHFVLPAGIAGRRHVDLSTVMEDGSTKKAIEQVLGYCQRRGVPVGIISNGHQLVAFFASRQDGVPPLNGRALCFSSPQEMVGDFSVLWNHLSRDGMAARNLQRILLGRNMRAMAPPKLSDQIGNYPGFRGRTALETDLKILGGLFIQDLESEDRLSEDFLRECYCNSGALSQYAMVSKEILKARYQPVEEIADVTTAPARTKRGVNAQLSGDMVTAAMSRRPLILLGDVGVGKSMFVKHLIKIDAADTLDKSLVFYVNFGNEPALETDLEAYVHRRLTTQLLDTHGIDIFENAFVRAVYNRELNQFGRGIYGSLKQDDPQEFGRQELKFLADATSVAASHLQRSLEHVRAMSGRSSVVVLDNIDQRPPDFQDRVFVIAQALAETWPTTVFVSLRPSTFYDSKSKGSLAAYQLRVFTVSPTRVDDVVLRRLTYARGQLERAGESGTFPQNLSLDSEDLIAYMDVLIKAFRDNDELKALLDNLSGGNLRLALTFLSAFVGSGYVSTQRVLEVARSGGVYTLPMHEFLRSIIFGEYDYFDPRASEVCNLFDISSDDGREHFLLPLLLTHVQRAGETAGGDGFVDVSSLYRHAQEAGFDQEQVGAQIDRAVDKRLVDTPPGKGTGGPFRITSVGSYMVRSMLRHFVYLDAVVVDTPILDMHARRQLRDVRSITERLARGQQFMDYLNLQWERLGIDPAGGFDWIAISQDLTLDMARAQQRTERADRGRL